MLYSRMETSLKNKNLFWNRTGSFMLQAFISYFMFYISWGQRFFSFLELVILRRKLLQNLTNLNLKYFCLWFSEVWSGLSLNYMSIAIKLNIKLICLKIFDSKIVKLRVTHVQRQPSNLKDDPEIGSVMG